MLLVKRLTKRTCVILAVLVCALTLGTGPARADTSLKDACSLFEKRIGWFTAASEVSVKWQVPVPVIMAVMYQESRFKAKAAAKTTTAYGYAQVLDGTWQEYKEETNFDHAVRTSFADSAEFIGWYMGQTRQRIGIPLDDVAGQYLAYHQGHVGYRSARWKDNPALVAIAHKVAKLAKTYEQQMRNCGRAPTVTVAEAGTTPLPASKPFALAEVSAVIPRRKPIDALFAEASVPRNGTNPHRWQ